MTLKKPALMAIVFPVFLFCLPFFSFAAPRNTIAVADFTNNAGYNGPLQIERMANEVFSILLVQTGKFRVLERTKVYSLQQEIEFNKSDWVNPKKAMKMGKMLGAEYIATGSITDIGAEAKSFSGYGVTTKNIIYSVSMEVKIIDTERGEITFGDLATASITHQQSSHLSQSPGEDIYRQLLRNALSKTVTKLTAALSGKPMSGIAPPGNARILIQSTPSGAEVEIGGNPMGKTPVTVTVADGTYSIKISKPGNRSWEREVRVTDGMKIKANLIAEGFQK